MIFLMQNQGADAYQLLLTGQVRTFWVEVPQGSGAQLLLGLTVQQFGCRGAGEQQQRAEERPAEQPGDLHGPGARQRVTLFPVSNSRSPAPNTFLSDSCHLLAPPYPLIFFFFLFVMRNSLLG